MDPRQKIKAFVEEYPVDRYGQTPGGRPLLCDGDQLLGLAEARHQAMALLLGRHPEKLRQALNDLVYSDLSEPALAAVRKDLGLRSRSIAFPGDVPNPGSNHPFDLSADDEEERWTWEEEAKALQGRLRGTRDSPSTNPPEEIEVREELYTVYQLADRVKSLPTDKQEAAWGILSNNLHLLGQIFLTLRH